MEMNNNFTAAEIKSLQKNANFTFDKTLDALRNVQSACFSMSSTVASGDSNLSEKWYSMGQSIADKIGKANAIITNIATELEKFVQETVENEKAAEESMNKLDEKIESLNNAEW